MNQDTPITSAAGSAEYQCPCCGAALKYSGVEQKMTCEFCDNSFDVSTVIEYRKAMMQAETREIVWEKEDGDQWELGEQESLRSFTCPACGGEIISDGSTAATFCPYCENPTILPGRVSGTIKPHGVIPFRKTKEDAQKALLEMCKGKPLLPKDFTSQHRLEKITGIYVPFWLYDCSGSLDGTYNATRVKTWSDRNYYYTKTDYYLLARQAVADFKRIPLDASSKMNDDIMESIEPYDYSDIVDFDTAYLSGYFADKYDVDSKTGELRIEERVDRSMEDLVRSSFRSYSSVVPNAKSLKAEHSKASYVLLPVWMLHTKYNGKTYVFAMNGQTGKITGTLPVCSKQYAKFFAGITAAVAIGMTVLRLIGLF